MKIRMEIREENNHGYIIIERLSNKWYLIHSWWLDIVHIELRRMLKGK
jgi:hypothetical protein